MDRRKALQAAIAVAAGTIGAGCAESPRSSAAPPAAQPQSGGPSATHLGTGGSTAPSQSTLPPEIAHGSRDRAAVALTFHGQGDALLVDELLSELAAGGARATVLAVGSWLAAQPELARRILDGGHELGNHTQNHAAIARMDVDQAFREIDECSRVLFRLTGSIGRWFRPSQTQHSTARIRAAAARAGYPTCVSYDVDSLDYTDPPAADIVRNTMTPIRNGSIVSMHCGHSATVAAIGPLLRELRHRGLRVVTMSELVGD